MPEKEMNTFGIVIHGGGGAIKFKDYPKDEEEKQIKDLNLALEKGYKILEKGGSSLDACTEAVLFLEDSPYYNAGKGAVLNSEAEHELDASIMCGSSKACGAVGVVKTIKNPILAARMVMEKSPHNFIAALGAEKFAKENGIEIVKNSYFKTEKRYQQYLKAKEQDVIILDHDDNQTGSIGTVGAVALDKNKNVAAATSTGGLTHKHPGRIGDTGVIGAGTYADNNTAALSCTGTGDVFLAVSAAKTISDLIEYKGLSLYEACKIVLENIKNNNGLGGVIGITQKADIIELFNTEGMFRGHYLSNGQKKVRVYKSLPP
jgi:beta-aspartyl-peptidase (threonine type)